MNKIELPPQEKEDALAKALNLVAGHLDPHSQLAIKTIINRNPNPQQNAWDYLNHFITDPSQEVNLRQAVSELLNQAQELAVNIKTGDNGYNTPKFNLPDYSDA